MLHFWLDIVIFWHFNVQISGGDKPSQPIQCQEGCNSSVGFPRSQEKDGYSDQNCSSQPYNHQSMVPSVAGMFVILSLEVQIQLSSNSTLPGLVLIGFPSSTDPFPLVDSIIAFNCYVFAKLANNFLSLIFVTFLVTVTLTCLNGCNLAASYSGMQMPGFLSTVAQANAQLAALGHWGLQGRQQHAYAPASY